MLIFNFIRQLQLCKKLRLPQAGTKLHASLFKSGLIKCQPLCNGLIDVYGKCGLLQNANLLFEEMTMKDQVSCASILTAFNQAKLPKMTLSIFCIVFNHQKLQPDHFVYACLIKACTNLCALQLGKQVHAHFILSPYTNDDVVKSSLIDMYSKCGLPKIAFLVFDSLLVKSSVSWTTMLSGYAKNGLKIEAVGLFRKAPIKNLYVWTAVISGLVQSGHGIDGLYLFVEMRREEVGIVDPLVLSSICGACAYLPLLDLGKQVHGLVISLGYTCCLFTNNALVDMYAKCCDVLSANQIFDRLIQRDVVSWTSIIVGVAQHGRATEALNLYDKMVLSGIKPNEVTFIGLIYACSHAGLVDKGKEIFKSMVENYRISPSLQHFTCLLDLLSRSGHLLEAENVINTMPFKPDEPTWAALLSACKRYGCSQLGLKFADQLLSLNPKDPSTYILLSNIYAGGKVWERVSFIRKMMTFMKFKKEPGYSCIDVVAL